MQSLNYRFILYYGLAARHAGRVTHATFTRMQPLLRRSCTEFYGIGPMLVQCTYIQSNQIKSNFISNTQSIKYSTIKTMLGVQKQTDRPECDALKALLLSSLLVRFLLFSIFLSIHHLQFTMLKTS